MCAGDENVNGLRLTIARLNESHQRCKSRPSAETMKKKRSRGGDIKGEDRVARKVMSVGRREIR